MTLEIFVTPKSKALSQFTMERRSQDSIFSPAKIEGTHFLGKLFKHFASSPLDPVSQLVLNPSSTLVVLSY